MRILNRLETEIRRSRYVAEKCFTPNWFQHHLLALNDPIQASPFEAPKVQMLKRKRKSQEEKEESTLKVDDSNEVPSSQPEKKPEKPLTNRFQWKYPNKKPKDTFVRAERHVNCTNCEEPMYLRVWVKNPVIQTSSDENDFGLE